MAILDILQYYYTSYVNKGTGSAGFQVKAMSPGVRPDLQSVIARLISYRIPPTFEQRPIGQHPIALRYYSKSMEECILLCSRSCGKDEYGRPGNFFAHAIILNADLFTSIPPILFWKSNFWQIEDPQKERRTINSLAPLPPSMLEAPALAIENIWEFLAQGQRRKLLRKLVAAVVYSSTSSRRIVIIDETENVAMWIAAVSILLPAEYRPLLSFATYYHDPYQSSFLITGIPKGSSFRAASEEHLTYFILDAEKELTSDVKPSLYADFVSKITGQELYETQLLPFFTYASRFPTPTCIDEQQLEAMALYTALLQRTDITALRPEELQILHTVVSSFEEQPSLEYLDEDIDEIKQLVNVILETFDAYKQPEVHREWERLKAIYEKNDIPTDALVMRELKTYTQMLLGSNNLERQHGIEYLEKLFEDRQVGFVQFVKDAEYLQWVCKQLAEPSVLQLKLIWQQIGLHLKPERESQELLLLSLRVVAATIEKSRFENAVEAAALKRDVDELIKIMWDAMCYPFPIKEKASTAQQDAWLALAIENYTTLPNGALEAFYYHLAYAHSSDEQKTTQLLLDARLPYRQLMWPISKYIHLYEMTHDLEKTSEVVQRLNILETWVKHAQIQKYDTPSLIEQGLKHLWRISEPEMRQVLAPKILRNLLFAPLSSTIETMLVKDLTSTISLKQFVPADVDLYTKYQSHSSLDFTTALILKSIVGLTHGEVDSILVMPLQQHVKALANGDYESAVEKCLLEFFQHPISEESHRNFISAFYVWTQGWNAQELTNSFWYIYQKNFIRMLVQPDTSKDAIRLLSFWFDARPREIPLSPYVVQFFFLTLPQVIAYVQKQHGFQDGVQTFRTQAAEEHWYRVVQPLFEERKARWRHVFGVIPRVIKVAGSGIKFFFSKEPIFHKNESKTLEKPLKVSDKEIDKLFLKKGALINHTRLLPQLYQSQHPEQFWVKYWRKFSDMVAHDADLTLSLLSFWFEHSFDDLGYIHYIPQEFFLGLVNALEEAHEEPTFHNTLNEIHTLFSQRSERRYTWYSLIVSVFDG